jgi:hypothetical protein
VLRVELPRHAAEPDPPQQAALAALVRGVGAALRIAEAYLRLRHAQRELDDAERVASLGAMAGGLAHEIKNPLLGLKLGLHLLKKDGRDAERLQRLEHDVGRIDDLVTGLLRFTHDGDALEDAGPVDVPELVRGCVGALRALADDRSAIIREAYPAGAARVHATPTQLRLVVNNLVKNALDAVPDPGRGGAARGRQRPGDPPGAALAALRPLLLHQAGRLGDRAGGGPPRGRAHGRHPAARARRGGGHLDARGAAARPRLKPRSSRSLPHPPRTHVGTSAPDG